MLAIYFLAFLHVTIENETFHVSLVCSGPRPQACTNTAKNATAQTQIEDIVEV